MTSQQCQKNSFLATNVKTEGKEKKRVGLKVKKKKRKKKPAIIGELNTIAKVLLLAKIFCIATMAALWSS